MPTYIAPVEDMMFTVAYQTGAPWNDTHWSNKHFDELLIAARAELDTTKRGKMYAEMNFPVTISKSFTGSVDEWSVCDFRVWSMT